MDGDLRRRLEADLKDAMRAGDVLGRDTIRFLLAALKNAEIEKRGMLATDEEVALLNRQSKRMQESIDQFRAGKRLDLVERETAQLAVVRRYLPASLSDEELSDLVAAVVAETGASGPKDLGKVMQVLIQRAGGRADGRRLSAAVRDALGNRG